jgi:hypothetical protein
LKKSKQSPSSGRPVGFEPPSEAVGAPINMLFLNCTLGNISTGGTWLPMALRSEIFVTFIPLSPDVTIPTSLIPLIQIILGGTQTVGLPISSKF